MPLEKINHSISSVSEMQNYNFEITFKACANDERNLKGIMKGKIFLSESFSLKTLVVSIHATSIHRLLPMLCAWRRDDYIIDLS